MTNEQILEILKKVIEKAIKNGYLSKGEWKTYQSIFGLQYLRCIEFGKPKYYSIIFSHDFAKAIAKYLISTGVTPEHQPHIIIINELGAFYLDEDGKADVEEVKNRFLQNMVVKEEPLKYLEKFLK